jgi:probable F420-dependent oxidoreductase
MKIRIGYGLGNLRPLSGDALGAMAEGLEGNGFDSLWLSERVSGPAPDPVLALTYAAARTKKIKLGTSVSVLPGRSPALVAKEWATLDVLSGGRALPAFGLGIAHPVEQQAFGVERADRASIFDEALPLLRRLWSETDIDHDGKWFHYEQMNVLPKPTHPLDVWLGGRAPSELRRVGRLADGWLASFATPEQCKAGRVAIEEAADAAGREIDPEHFGVMALYTHDPIPDAFAQAIKSRNPDVEIDDLVARGWQELHDLCARYVAVGFSKLVLVPLGEPRDWNDELAAGASTLLPLQGKREARDELRLEEAAQAHD